MEEAHIAEDTQAVGDLALEIAFLRGALQVKEQECQQMMADRMLMSAQQEALLRSVSELTVKIATMSTALMEVISNLDTEHVHNIRAGLFS